MIAPKWLMENEPSTKRVIEGMLSDDEIVELNVRGYNAYYFPNAPKQYVPGVSVDGSLIDDFRFVFVDMDLKDGHYPSKDAFLQALAKAPEPTQVVDSGNGVHAYWQVSDLDAMSYLKLSRRLMRYLNTDEAVGQILQLMRLT
jgi:hypothetical protein